MECFGQGRGSMSETLPNVFQQFMWNGAPVAGGKLYSYAAGSSLGTPLATYTNQGAGTQNANPTILSSNGVANIWIPQTTGYQFQLQDSLGNVLWTVDNIILIPNGSIGSAQFANGAVGSSQFAANAVTSTKFTPGAVGSLKFQSGSVGSTQLATGGIQIYNFQESIDLTTLQNSVGCAVRRYDDPVSGAGLSLTPQYPTFSGTPTLLGTPGTLPTGAPNACKFSPDGRFLVFGHATTPFVTIYERCGANFSKVPNPSGLPAGTVHGMGWSPDGNLLSCGTSTTPFLTTYQRQGLNFTPLGTPGTLPATTGLNANFSPNGEFLQIANSHIISGAGSVMYQRLVTTLSFLSLGVSPGSGNGFGSTAWSPDSQYIFGVDGLSGIGEIYQRVGSAFNSLGFESSVFNATWASTYDGGISSAWSPDGSYLAIGCGNTPYILVYAWANQTLTAVILPTPIPQGPVNALAWSHDSRYLALAYTGTSACVDVYQNNFNGTFSIIQSQLAPNSLTQANGVSWSPSGQFLAVATNSSPYVAIYEGASSMPTNGSLFSRNFADV